MRDDKRRTEDNTAREELLTEIFSACMEEQLSFIPPERELARMHTFSPEFEESMTELCRNQSGRKSRRITRKEFTYGFNRAAACVLACLIVGGLAWGGYSILKGGRTGDEMTEMVTDTAAEATQEAMAEESDEAVIEFAGTDEAKEIAADEDAAATETADPPKEVFFANGTVKLAAEQELPEESETVRTLVTSPSISVDAESLVLTIGNTGESDVIYYLEPELQVYILGAWYVVPTKEELSVEEQNQMDVLEAGMAVNQEIRFENYVLDTDAEQYRFVTYVDDTAYGAPFRFETLSSGLEDILEDDLSE